MAVLVISYSRADRDRVRAVVTLLRAALRDVEKAVFWDEDFDPGDPWFTQICQHIDSAPQLFVFWCRHSASSDQVRREFRYALGQGKRVVPVLMDNTALAAELAPIHGIDLRGAILHAGFGDTGTPGPDQFETRGSGIRRATVSDRAPSPLQSARAWFAAGITIITVAAVTLLTVGYYGSTPSDPAQPDRSVIDPPITLPPLPHPADATQVGFQLALLAGVALLGLAAAILMKRRWRRRPDDSVSSSGRIVQQDRIVSEFSRFI